MVKKAAEATPNHLLRTARKEHNWTQKEVADAIGSPQSFNISRWEQGTAFPSAHYIQQLCLLFGKSARELGLWLEAPTEKSESSPYLGMLNQSDPIWKMPAFLTPLIGREQEVADICARLSRPGVRLLTLLGSGGIGKTRLGTEVATQMRTAFADGVCFVGLAPISDPDLVLSTIAGELGIQEQSKQLLIEQVKTALCERHLLLFLDNIEQVISAVPALEGLLVACPFLKILATSRAVLHLQAEYLYPVPPLSMPDLAHLPGHESLMQYEALAFFVERAQAQLPTFHLSQANARTVAEICVRLEGLPLALELAAARIRLLPPKALLARLSQRLALLTGGAKTLPERQQTLRNTLMWSYDLLDRQEQRLFRILSVFVGGWTLEAVETICTTLGDPVGQFIDGVASLLDKSIAHQTEQQGEEPRFVMLETIREFGIEALAESGEMQTTRAAHATYYLALAEEADMWLWGPQLQTWLERLEREHDNLRAALSWSLEQGPCEDAGRRKEVALRLGGALHRFWFSHGHLSEGRTFLERALAASSGVAKARNAKALIVAADLASNLVHSLEDIQLGEMLVEEALVLYRAIGDWTGIAHSLALLGWFAGYKNECARARTLFEESVVLLKKLGNQWYLGWSLCELANLDAGHGEHVKAQAEYEEALVLWRESGDKEAVAILLTRLARLLYNYQGNLITARSMSDEALMLSRELGSKQGVVYSLSLLAEIALRQGDVALALQLSEETLTLCREMGGDKVETAIALSVLARVEARQGNYDTARHLYETLLTLAREVDDKVNLTFYLEGLAEVVAKQGELVWSARLWGTAEFLRDAIASPLPSFYRTDYERAVAAARTRLGDQAFDVAWAEGRSITIEQVLAVPTSGGVYSDLA